MYGNYGEKVLRSRREVEQSQVFETVNKCPNISPDFPNLDVAQKWRKLYLEILRNKKSLFWNNSFYETFVTSGKVGC